MPNFLNGTQTLDVPVYTIYGAAEDLIVLERFKEGTYKVPNLHIIDETSTYSIKTPSGLSIRLFGLGGSLVIHRLFDHGDASLSIAGSPGVMWTSMLQMGQLISTVQKSFVPSEIRVFVTHPSPSREGLLAQLAVTLRTDFTISSGLHFLYGSSFNEFSALPSIEHFRGILAVARSQFMDLWDAVKVPLFSLVDDVQNQQLKLAYDVFESMPLLESQQPSEDVSKATPSATGNNSSITNTNNTTSSAHSASSDGSIEYLEVAFRNMWHFNLCDHTNGALVLVANGGHISSESYSEGFNFEYRLSPQTPSTANPTSGKAPSISVPRNGSTVTSTLRKSPAPPSDKPARTILKSTPASKSDKQKPVSPSPTSATIATNTISANTFSNSKTAAQSAPTDSKAASSTAAQSSTSPAAQGLEPPGVWIANGNADEDQIRGYFDEADRKYIKSVVKKGNYANPERMFALVYFSTPEEASNALKNLDFDKAGTRSNLIRQPHAPSNGNESTSFSNGSGKGHRSTGSTSSSGWTTAGSSRGGRGSYRGRGSASSGSFSKHSSRPSSSKLYSNNSSSTSTTIPTSTSTSTSGSPSIAHSVTGSKSATNSSKSAESHFSDSKENHGA